MKIEVKNRLEELRIDYERQTGHPFKHFYCPILWRDEPVELCKAHIIPQASSGSSRKWTIQRKDVDGFYGTYFEDDFLDIQRFEEKSLAEIVTDPLLSKKFNAKIYFDNEPVETFFTKGDFPEQYTPIKVEDMDPKGTFGIKVHRSDFILNPPQRTEVKAYRDVRVPMAVSTIKAAHLTLFSILGYHYGATAAAEFVGNQILGQFYSANVGKSREQIKRNAIPFFREFKHMMRPLIGGTFQTEGTITDRILFMCVGSSKFIWGMIVIVKFGDHVWMVLVPAEGHEQIATYLDFIKNGSQTMHVAACRYNWEEQRWEMSTETQRMNWPKEDIKYPEEG